MIKLQRLLAALCGILLSLSLAMTLLTLLLDGMGSSAPLMTSIMTQHAPTDVTGLPADDYTPMAEMVTDYLSGRTADFQYTLTDADGVQSLCYTSTEQAHMADCKALFTLDRQVLLIALLIACLSLVALYRLRAYKRQGLYGFVGGNVTVLAAMAVLGIWGMVDFDSLFVLFHRLSFSNMLWILDPHTSLLIRLMPTSFFVHYAALLLGTWLGLTVLFLLGAILWLKKLHAAKNTPAEGRQRSEQ